MSTGATGRESQQPAVRMQIKGKGRCGRLSAGIASTEPHASAAWWGVWIIVSLPQGWGSSGVRAQLSPAGFVLPSAGSRESQLRCGKAGESSPINASIKGH